MPFRIDPYSLSPFLLILFVFCLYKLWKLLQHQALLRKVSWCISGSGRDCYNYLGKPCWKAEHLSSAIDTIARDYPHTHKINTLDRFAAESLDIILNEYKKDLSLAYFQNRLTFPRRFHKMSERDYFFFTLDHFLSEHECDREICGHEMREHIESKYYNGDGRTDTDYLTPFGLVYAKLHYIVLSHCILTPAINSNGLHITTADYLREEIETGIITISHFRP